jgi:hypothetical protein
MHTNPTRAFRTKAVQAQSETLRRALQPVQDLPATLRYERPVSPNQCLRAIGHLRTLEGAVQMCQQVVAHHRQAGALSALVALHSLEEAVDEAILALVAVREAGPSMTMAVLRVRKQALQHIARVLREAEETLDKLAADRLLPAEHETRGGGHP